MTHHAEGTAREALAEFLGTFVLIVLGVGVVAQVVLSQQTAGTYLSINLAWGLAVTMGCYVARGVSGAHINPAVTLALAVHRGFPWRNVGPYVLAQMAGAFAASAVVYFTYLEALRHFDGGVRQVVGAQATAAIWATYPQPFLSVFPGGFIDQVVGTAILMGVVLAIADARNAPPVSGMAPLIIGLLVAVIGMSFGTTRATPSTRRVISASLHGARGLGGRRVPRRERLVVDAHHRTGRGRGARRLGLRRLHRTAVPARAFANQPGVRVTAAATGSAPADVAPSHV